MRPPALSLLPLKDVHPGTAPGWWPPAPGWWWLAGVTVLLTVLAVLALGRAWRRRRQRRAWLAAFDAAVAGAASPPEQVAVLSEWLRRAARRIDPHSDRLQGDAWLHFLDAGLPAPVFVRGPGTLLRDGAFRPALDAAAVAALRDVARQRFQSWMRDA